MFIVPVYGDFLDTLYILHPTNSGPINQSNVPPKLSYTQIKLLRTFSQYYTSSPITFWCRTLLCLYFHISFSLGKTNKSVSYYVILFCIFSEVYFAFWWIVLAISARLVYLPNVYPNKFQKRTAETSSSILHDWVLSVRPWNATHSHREIAPLHEFI